jgi:hypothetical protein
MALFEVYELRNSPLGALTISSRKWYTKINLSPELPLQQQQQQYGKNHTVS